MKINRLKVAMAQVAPVWADRSATIAKTIALIDDAADSNSDLIIFGEGHIPGYPHWLGYTGGAQWNDPIQKEIFAHYASNAVCIEKGDLKEICSACAKRNIAAYLGIIEQPKDRAGHSLYCTLVFIDRTGVIQSIHRKLQPTHDERLVWSYGDGHGLKAHELDRFTVGGLNCWENWMPMARSAMYAQGVNIHVAVWPGSDHNTKDITRFIALESRSYVISVGSLSRKRDFPPTTPHLEVISNAVPETLTNGGSCIAAPDGSWLIAPDTKTDGLIYAELDYQKILKERQNFDPSGHYSRPDVLQLNVNRERQQTVKFT